MGKRGPKPKTRKIQWTAKFAYGVGLMTSDGCLSSDGRHLLFVTKDLEQARNFKKSFDLKVKIGRHVSGRKNANRIYYKVQWGDVFLYQYFVSIGITPRKSHTIGEVLIPKKYLWPYLRGHFDGDGSFYSYFDSRWKSSFMFYMTIVSSSKAYIAWVREEIEKEAGIQGHVAIDKKRTFYQLRYAKRESCILIGKMYAKSEAFYLKRKKLKIKRALGIVGIPFPKG